MRKRTLKIPGVAILGICVVLTIVLLVLTTTGTVRIPFLDTVVRVVFVPVQKFSTSVVRNTQAYFEDMAFQRDLKAEYQNLQDQYKQSQLQLAEMEELRRENARYRELLGRAEEDPAQDYVLARVIAMNPGNWFSSFSIDVGSAEGIKKDDVVLTADGLVGRVTQVYTGYATVMSIIDGRSAVSGLIERTRDNGMVRGNLSIAQQDELCRMVYLPSSAELQFGDRVLTSGLDGIFPKGLLIGTVRDVSREEATERYVVVNPSVDFQRLEEVLVLRIDRAAATEEEQ